MTKRGLSLEVLTEKQYFAEATRKIKSAKKGVHIAAITMTFDPDEPPVTAFVDALINAAGRGCKVLLVVDAHSFMVNHFTDMPNGPIMRHAQIENAKLSYYRRKLRKLKELEQSGGTYKIINTPRGVVRNPVAGRSHIKATVIGDELYLGGCNLSGTEQIDLMTHLSDSSTASYMYSLIHDIAAKQSTQTAMKYRDQELPLDGQTSLLVDSGEPGQSLIFEQALELIDNADEWLVMTCQYFPNSITARHLAAARGRGVQVHLYYNHPSKHEHVGKLAHRLVILQERSRNPKGLFEREGSKKQPRIHAKLIATEKGAIIGSHNYVRAGVKLGTAEAAVLRRDPAFARRAAKIIEDQLANISLQ